LKYKELILNHQEEGDLYRMLSIDDRKNQITKGSQMILERDLSDDDEEDEEDKKLASDLNDPLSVKKKSSQANKRSTKKKKSKPKDKDKDTNIEDKNISLMMDLKRMSRPENDINAVKSLKGGDLFVAKAYLAFPPQMNFVPDEEVLEKLILNATKYRHAKDIPKII
jgi:hypothetical protein